MEASTSTSEIEWRRRELERREREENPRREHALRGPEAYDDKMATAAVRAECGIERSAHEMGRRSRTVERRIASSCAGWPRRPTAAEFYDAVRAKQPTDRQMCLIRMWVREASEEETIFAWTEEVYSDRMLVAAMHRCGAAAINPTRNAGLNRATTR